MTHILVMSHNFYGALLYDYNNSRQHLTNPSMAIGFYIDFKFFFKIFQNCDKNIVRTKTLCGILYCS